MSAADQCLLDRAGSYLDRMPAAISGQNGHKALFRAALALVRGFTLPQEAALSLLRERYNPRCEPTWTDKELNHKVRQAEKDGEKAPPKGYLLTEPERGSRGRRRFRKGQPVPRNWRGSSMLALPADLTKWPESWREVLEERAAIMEFDGGLSRDEAERRAEAVARATYSRGG